MFLPQLPITVSVGRPSRLELLGLSGCALLVVSAVAWTHTAARPPPPAPAEPPREKASLAITSTPSGAVVVIDGQAEGSTPTTVGVTPGRHDIMVDAPDAIDETRTLDVDSAGASLEIVSGARTRALPTSSLPCQVRC
ncbi:MAG: PEGA domain-containing protein [Chloroflexota bacterium]|nr:PEGA domain-containing protein [Chloroflexota bacterium]